MKGADHDESPPRPPLAFLSYARADADRALSVASLIRKAGFRVWIDSEVIRPGAEFAKAITSAIEDADLFVVCISPSSVESTLVTRELTHALSLSEERGRPQPFPVKLIETELPSALTRLQYFDATQSTAGLEKELRRAARKLRPKVGISRYRAYHFPPLGPTIPPEVAGRAPPTKPTRVLSLSAISIVVKEVTEKYYGGAGNGITEDDVRREQITIQKQVRERVQGVLTNFVQEGAILDTGGVVLVRDGEFQTEVEKIIGPLPGSLRLSTTVKGVLVKPDKRRVVRALPRQVNNLGVDAVEYTFLLSPPPADLGGRILNHFRENGSIVSQGSDRIEGETEDGCRVTVGWSVETLRLGIPTRCMPTLDGIQLAEGITRYTYV